MRAVRKSSPAAENPKCTAAMNRYAFRRFRNSIRGKMIYVGREAGAQGGASRSCHAVPGDKQTDKDNKEETRKQDEIAPGPAFSGDGIVLSIHGHILFNSRRDYRPSSNSKDAHTSR